jgi:serine O-acetyltransferase
MPENSTAVGIPAKVVRREGVRVDPLDHVHIPDPVAAQIKQLEGKLAELEAQIKELNSKKQD